MLTVTPTAADALASLLRSPEVPDGVRLERATTPSGEPSIGMHIVSAPEATDEIVDTGAGVDVFVDADAADALADQQLDVEAESGRLSFTLRRQGLSPGDAADPSQKQ